MRVAGEGVAHSHCAALMFCLESCKRQLGPAPLYLSLSPGNTNDQVPESTEKLLKQLMAQYLTNMSSSAYQCVLPILYLHTNSSNNEIN